jgi:spore coat protein U-like protein
MKRLFLFPVVSGLILAFSPSVYCGPSASTLNVSINVVEMCSITTSPLEFGDYNPSEGAAAEGSVEVTCPKGLPYKVALDAGENSRSGHLRRMSNGSGDYLPYKIWKDPHHRCEWGDSDFDNTYPAGRSLCVKGCSVVQSHPVFGTVRPHKKKDLPTGKYTDVVNVKVYY